ncbi:hypothetical protein [Amycolatopsis taiwanensis]|uniref:Uncharacterized protein n=1 Tax=Amycolatopsis taiwanensis TaxID=342230 RepID=A0A9W6VII1_9PSEU|nr:hypothetical protein [Amycolatopsis taiwanensis]GLY68469.1 hypothetical protein Atai01_50880 [Amycolatopsis taiwanensis]
MTTSWNRPMLLFAGLMGVMTVVCVGGLLFDDRILIGAPIWAKPFKFAVSMGIYCLTWAWLASLVARGRRLVNLVSAGVVAMLAVEYVIIVGQTVRGRPSHFDVGTSFDRLLYIIMAISAGSLWLGTLALSVPLMRTPIIGAANRLAIRLGAVIALIGIGIAVLMTTPRPGQPGAQGVVGAHSVGVADDGPGLPILGWSTTGGDLRIPHFFGMHALQALPLFALLLGRLARRFPRLRTERVQTRLVAIAAAVYVALLALVTWQALRGQSIVHPDALTLGVLAALVVGAAGGTLITLTRRDAVPLPEPGLAKTATREVVR